MLRCNFFLKKWGVGLYANYATASAKNRTYRETDHFVYIAPSASFRGGNERFLIILSVGAGPMFYNAKYNDPKGGTTTDQTLDKTVLGFHLSASGERKLNKNLALGGKIGFAGGSIKMGNTDKRFSVANFLIGSYISFRTW